MKQITILTSRYAETGNLKETRQNDCLSKLNDGKQVRPASAKPGNVHVRKVRQSDWELMRE